MECKSIDQYGDILYLPDVMEYLQIGRNTALAIFNTLDFPALRFDSKRKRVLKSEFIKNLARIAA